MDNEARHTPRFSSAVTAVTRAARRPRPAPRLMANTSPPPRISTSSDANNGKLIYRTSLRLNGEPGVELLQQTLNADMQHIHEWRRRQPDPQHQDHQGRQRDDLAPVQVAQMARVWIVRSTPDDPLQHPVHVGGAQNHSRYGQQAVRL